MSRPIKRVNSSCQEINKFKRPKLTRDYVTPPFCPTLTIDIFPGKRSVPLGYPSGTLLNSSFTAEMIPTEDIPPIEMTPRKEVTPTEELAPTEELTPTEELAPSEELAPTEDNTSIGTTPTDATPVTVKNMSNLVIVEVTENDSSLYEHTNILQEYLNETLEQHKEKMSALLEDYKIQVDSHLSKVRKLMEEIIQEFTPQITTSL
ncbi:hypothetical protein INT47_005904 [Mucor saturninus]|uniref:Uncharacterized protein n=1 Tax=Mucor saturninus TaxID=64648 RepID=A0A8H7R8B3_9FUNG|nr:hypothetical protein INT47_005904 [Mucor saturninus]